MSKSGHYEVAEHKKTPAMKFADKRAKMVELFGEGADQFVGVHPMIGSIDIIGLDDWLIAKFGDYQDDETSMADFVERQFGKEAKDWLEANLDPVM